MAEHENAKDMEEVFDKKTKKKPDIAKARQSLEEAIAQHERHMSGKEPTSKDSQMDMMGKMKAALAALGG